MGKFNHFNNGAAITADGTYPTNAITLDEGGEYHLSVTGTLTGSVALKCSPQGHRGQYDVVTVNGSGVRMVEAAAGDDVQIVTSGMGASDDIDVTLNKVN